MARSETYLDEDFDNSFVSNLYRKDRNRYEAGVALYSQEYIATALREVLMNNEMLWVQICLPYSKPALTGCCYRPPSSALCYLDELGTNIDRACDEGKNIFILGDFNVECFSKDCPLYRKLSCMMRICHLSQTVDQATGVSFNKNGAKTSTCTDLIFTNVPTVSRAIGCRYPNLIAISRETKMPKALGSYKDSLFKNSIQTYV